MMFGTLQRMENCDLLINYQYGMMWYCNPMIYIPEQIHGSAIWADQSVYIWLISPLGLVHAHTLVAVEANLL